MHLKLRSCGITQLISTLLVLPSTGAELAHYYDFENGFDDLAGEAEGTAGSEVTTVNGFDGGQAALFPGSLASSDPFDERGYAGISPAITEISGDFSVSYRVKLAVDDTSTSARGIFDFSGDGGDGPQSLYLQTGPNQNKMVFRVDGLGSSNALTFIDVPEDDTWFFVTATFSPGNELRVYLDGQLAATIDAGATNDVTWNTDQYLGAFNINGTGSAKGLEGALDDFAVYTGILTAGEIADLSDGILSPADFGLTLPIGEFFVSGLTVSGNSASLIFGSRTLNEYRIFGGSDLSNPAAWTEFTTAPLIGTGEIITAPLTLEGNEGKLFFQVRESPKTNPGR